MDLDSGVLRLIPAEQVHGLIRTAIILNDDFQILIGLVQDGLKLLVQEAGTVVGGHQD